MANNLSPKLTLDQLKQNIDALRGAGQDIGSVQSYVDNYQLDPDGGYSLKGMTQEPVGPNIESLRGVAKGIGSSILGGAQLLTKGLEKAGVVPEGTATNETARMLRELVTPKGDIQKAFFGAEQAAEFLVPAGKLVKAPAAISSAISKLPSSAQVAMNIAAKAGLSAADFGIRTGIQTGGDKEAVKTASKIGAVFGALGGAFEQAAPVMLKKAQNIYQSALKPSGAKRAPSQAAVVRTGLEEGIVLSEGGVAKISNTIDDLEETLGSVISAAPEGATVKTSSLKPFIDEAKKSFTQITDVAFSKKAVSDMDDIFNSFVKEYGDEIPIQAAQDLKVRTGQWLRKAYGELASPVLEANKQLVRGLKEGIVEIAPKAGDINARLRKLYEFDEALQRYQGRVKNLNLLGLGTKVLAAGAKGPIGAAIAAVNEIFGSPGAKSFTAIQLYRLSKVLNGLTPAEATTVIGRIPALSALVAKPEQEPDGQ